MLDALSGRAVALVDWTRSSPAWSIMYIGDCLRSSCNLLGMRPGTGRRCALSPTWAGPFCAAIWTRPGLPHPGDYEYLYDAIRCSPFETGLRFFTDYLAATSISRPAQEHNLLRALVQIQLTKSIEAQESVLRAHHPDETDKRERCLLKGCLAQNHRGSNRMVLD